MLSVLNNIWSTICSIGDFFVNIGETVMNTIKMMAESIKLFNNLVYTAQYVIPYLPTFIITACCGTIVLAFIKTFLARGGGG